MAYQNISTPRIYLNIPEYLASTGVAIDDVFRTLPVSASAITSLPTDFGGVTLTDADVDCGVNVEQGVDWIGQGHGPAKSVTILPTTGDATDEIKVYLKIAGSYGDAITVNYADFPLTLDNLLIDRIKISSDDNTANTEIFSIIAFH